MSVLPAGASRAPVVVVSCIYKLPPPTDGDVTFRASYFQELWKRAQRLAMPLFHHKVPMVIFCDDADMGGEAFERVMPANVMPLDTFPGAHVFDACRFLPSSRNIEKDTSAYMSLVAGKVDMVEAATHLYPAASHFVYVDAGCDKNVHMSDTLDRAARAMKTAAGLPQDAVVMPGRLAPVPFTQEGHASLTQSIWFRFAGCVFIMPRGLARDFAGACIQAAQTFAPFAVWEVHVWAWIEACPHATVRVRWVYGEHDDSMFQWLIDRPGNPTAA